MPDSDVTLHQAASLLGVHYMTVYRYVRLGLLPARKEGGTWHIDTADVEHFRDHRPGGAASTVRPGVRHRAPWAARFEARLVAGDAPGAWGVIEAAMSSGAGLDEVYLDIISPAMTSIGERWQRGELDVADEHLASGIAFRVVGRLGPRFVRRGRTRGAVVLGAPPGEGHALPVAMLADLVRMQGWAVSDLGADVPEESFVRAVAATPDLVAVGISVIDDSHLPAAARLVTALRSSGAVRPRGVLLVVGGRAVRGGVAGPEWGPEWGADAVVPDARSFIDMLHRITD